MFGWVVASHGGVTTLGFHWPRKLGHYTMRPCGTPLPVFGGAKMWSRPLKRIVPSRHPSCWVHGPSKKLVARWTQWWSSDAAGLSCAFCNVAWQWGGYKWPTSNSWLMTALPRVTGQLAQPYGPHCMNIARGAF